MKDRCTNPNHISYKNYGARGIHFDERWMQFANFLEDMGERPLGTTLDREDNDGPYCKDNCKWSTPAEQIHNRRNSHGSFNER